MDFKDYKAGIYKQQYRYQSFMPTLINHTWQVNDSHLALLLSQADNKLGGA